MMGATNAEIGDDDPVLLSKACALFLNGALTKSALRTEHRRGNLEIIRIANKDFVTRNGIRRMIERCKLPTDSRSAGDADLQTRRRDAPEMVLTRTQRHQAVKAQLAAHRQKFAEEERAAKAARRAAEKSDGRPKH
jgi:hypothetical protein